MVRHWSRVIVSEGQQGVHVVWTSRHQKALSEVREASKTLSTLLSIGLTTKKATKCVNGLNCRPSSRFTATVQRSNSSNLSCSCWKSKLVDLSSSKTRVLRTKSPLRRRNKSRKSNQVQCQLTVQVEVAQCWSDHRDTQRLKTLSMLESARKKGTRSITSTRQHCTVRCHRI